MSIKLYPHQRQAANKLSNGKVLWGEVGSGKSLVALTYYIENELDKQLLIITTAKKRDSGDWVEEALHLGITDITVDSWQNIKKYEGVMNVFLVADEQRLVGSGAWVRSFLRIARQNHWILLSATPGDSWLDYIPVFVANGFYRNRTEFLREHAVFSRYARYPRLERYINTGKLIRLRNQILVEMPYDKHTTRDTKIVYVEHNKTLMKRVMKDRWHVYENRPLRDSGEMHFVMRKVVNSDPERIESMIELMQKHPKVIVFYNFDYELELLRSLPDLINSRHEKQYASNSGKDSWNSLKESPDLTSRSLSKDSTGRTLVKADYQSSLSETNTNIVNIAEWNGHKHEPIPDSDRWIYLVQYAAGAEGWNCTETDTVVFYSLTYSYKYFHQAHGRIDRLNTTYVSLYYYILLSNSYIDQAIIRALNRKKSFNEAKSTVFSRS